MPSWQGDDFEKKKALEANHNAVLAGLGDNMAARRRVEVEGVQTS